MIFSYYNKNTKNKSCYGCEHRTLGCHDNCPIGAYTPVDYDKRQKERAATQAVNNYHYNRALNIAAERRKRKRGE